MSTLLEKAKEVRQRYHPSDDVSKEHWEVVKAWYMREISTLQASTVLAPMNRSSVYHRTAVITRVAVERGWLKL